MELSGLDKHKNKIFNFVVIIIAAIIAFNFIYKRQLQEMRTLNEKKDMEIKKNEVLGNIARLEKRISAYKKLLTKKDAGSVINTISDMAKESEVKIISIRPGQEEGHPEYIKFPFDLVVNSVNYHALGRFISKLESYRDIVYIVDVIEISPGFKKGELTANLKLSTIQFID